VCETEIIRLLSLAWGHASCSKTVDTQVCCSTTQYLINGHVANATVPPGRGLFEHKIHRKARVLGSKGTELILKKDIVRLCVGAVGLVTLTRLYHNHTGTGPGSLDEGVSCSRLGWCRAYVYVTNLAVSVVEAEPYCDVGKAQDLGDDLQAVGRLYSMWV
jgi:hypothetical protein